jgi:hypothetical protein
MMSTDAREVAQATELRRGTVAGADERLAGYGVMGLPFATGHYLALRRFPANPFGAPYSSVWHRDPAGRWTFYNTAAPSASCPRFFGAAVDTVIRTPIALDWTGPGHLEVTAGPVRWSMDLTTTPATAAMTAMARTMPRAAWESRLLLAAMSRFVRPVLAAGRIRLTGTVPNGQWFEAAPRVLLAVTRSAASVDGVDLGPLGPLPQQARLGDFWLPQRGLFMVGESVFETFDPSHHHAPDPDTAFAVVDQGAGGRHREQGGRP